LIILSSKIDASVDDPASYAGSAEPDKQGCFAGCKAG